MTDIMTTTMSRAMERGYDVHTALSIGVAAVVRTGMLSYEGIRHEIDSGLLLDAIKDPVITIMNKLSGDVDYRTEIERYLDIIQ
ncbi:MAG: hypothetical protein HY364_01265 [Candidatus Aenigmarchaeota archaeon]|nr:hypothetical protein [Candidatus Aenigmarchaeota archaeon]